MKLTIELGHRQIDIELAQFRPEPQQWESVNPLTSTVPELMAAHEAEQEAGR